MENFSVDQKLHLSRYLDNDDLFYPCNELTSEYKGDCYMYAPTYYLARNPDDYAGALRWCKSAELPHQETCISGVGSQMIKDNINSPLSVESVCMRDTSDTAACVEGMVNTLINHYGALAPAMQLCDQLHPKNQDTCRSTIGAHSWLFEGTEEYAG
jgi:hypothetical protein